MNYIYTIIGYLIFLIILMYDSRPTPCVEIAQGTVEGAIDYLSNGELFYSFKGIPYAAPPIGEYRFKAPQLAPTWQGIRNATKHGPMCPQYLEHLDRIEEGSEDCLFVNVYTKHIRPIIPQPVFVFIHGGGFYTGSGNSEFYGPEYILEYDVVFVTFNYRLEVLGFLSLDNEDVPGNAGLKDQVAALTWVKENIAKFGGDVNSITIGGCSAGSSSVTFHMLSPLSQGLFNKAIAMSGVALSDWTVNKHTKERAYQLAEHLGTKVYSDKELLSFLRSVPSKQLINIKLPPLNTTSDDVYPFVPVIEKNFRNTKGFLTEKVIDILNNKSFKKLPLLIGYTNSEGIEMLRFKEYYPKAPKSMLTNELRLSLDESQYEEVGKQIKDFYIKKETLIEYMNYTTDVFMLYDIRRFIDIYASESEEPVFLYEFGYVSERNVIKKRYGFEEYPGPCHAEDILYLFNVTLFPIPKPTVETLAGMKKIIKLWMNFVIYGNPTISDDFKVKWKPYKSIERNYYIIDKEFKASMDPARERMIFWETINKTPVHK